jgi:hypothetical protein
MKNILMLAFALAMVASAASAVDSSSPGMPRKHNPVTGQMDAKGNCHDASGKFTSRSNCAPSPKHCRDPQTGRFTKCPA